MSNELAPEPYSFDKDALLAALRHFASMIASGTNARHISDAADAIEYLDQELQYTREQLAFEQDMRARYAELWESTALQLTEQQTSLSTLSDSIAAEKSLRETEREHLSAELAATREAHELQRARLQAELEDARQRTAAGEQALEAVRNELAELKLSIQKAEEQGVFVAHDVAERIHRQFIYLAEDATQSRDIVARVQATIGACLIEQAGLNENEAMDGALLAIRAP